MLGNKCDLNLTMTFSTVHIIYKADKGRVGFQCTFMDLDRDTVKQKTGHVHKVSAVCCASLKMLLECLAQYSKQKIFE